MDPEPSDGSAPSTEADKWLQYYAEASKRRRARGWHRRRQHLRARKRIPSAQVMIALLCLAAVATAVTLLLPR